VVWDKLVHGIGDTSATFAPQHELAVFATKGRYKFPSGRPKTVIRAQRPSGKGRTHPCEKPVELHRQLIEALTRPGELVLDPFMGTGSAGVAAAESGRSYLGIELDKAYARTARARVRQARRFLTREASP